MTESDVKNKLKHLDRLKSTEERNNFESLWQSGADFCNPDDSDVRRTSGKGQQRTIRRVTDAGIEARRGFATGMYSWAIGDGEFFRYSTSESELMGNESVKRWFNDVNQITMNELQNSNFDSEVLQSFGELSYIGTSATFTEWHNSSLNFKTQHISQFWIDVDSRCKVDTVFVEFMQNPKQLISEFGEKNVPDFILDAKKANSNEEFAVVQSCSKNPDYNKDSINPLHREFISVYILRKEEKILREDGYETFPFAVSRLYKAKNEIYGRCCYMECSKSINLNNDQEVTLIRGGKNRADPPWIEAADSRVRHIRSNEISKVIYDPTSLGGPPQQMDMRNDVGITVEMLERTESRINKAFLIDAFNPILDHRNMTKYETAQRIGIGLSKVSPALNKWHSEYATPLFERIFDILNKKGKFPAMPEILDGKKFKLSYVSKAALALKEIQLNNVQAAISDAIERAQFVPDVLDNYDFDEVERLSAEAYNIPNSIIRSSDIVEDIRETRAQQQAQQQQIENAPAIADAAYKAAQIGEE